MLFEIYNRKGFLYGQNTEDDWFRTEKKTFFFFLWGLLPLICMLNAGIMIKL